MLRAGQRRPVRGVFLRLTAPCLKPAFGRVDSGAFPSSRAAVGAAHLPAHSLMVVGYDSCVFSPDGISDRLGGVFKLGGIG